VKLLSAVLLSTAAFVGGIVVSAHWPFGADAPRPAFKQERTSSNPPGGEDVTGSISGSNELDDIANGIKSLRGDRPASPDGEPLQQQAQAPNPQQRQPEEPPAAAPQVDESALRYFAAKGDQARLAAEIARLRSLYPNWTPPADPLAVPQNPDRQLENMWQLYAEGQYAEVRRAIAVRQAAEAGWQPPPDLIERLEVAEARARLVNASDLKQFQTVIDVGASSPALLNCSDIDVLWRVAEAFFRTDRPQRAVDAYSYVLKNCPDPQERLATIQKASALLPYQSMQPLLALERTENGQGEFDSIEDDLARRFVAQANEDPALSVAPAYIERLRELAETGAEAEDALLLGWYYLRRNAMTQAENWFRRARQRADSASASQGLALALLARNAPAEAEEAMFPWRDSSEEATAAYLAATANLLAAETTSVISEQVLARMAETVVKQRYVPAAQQFGWYARRLEQPQTAGRWFETALGWSPEDEPSAYGLALTKLQLNDRQGVADLQRLWSDRSARIATLRRLTSPEAAELSTVPQASRRTVRSDTASESDAGMAPAVSDQPRRVVTRARRPAGCSTTTVHTGTSSAQALASGWCLMELNRPLEAATAFEAALGNADARISEEAAYGQSLAYLRLGLADKASVAAAKAPMNTNRANELQAAILAERAVNAFGAKRYRETLVYLDQRAQVQQEPVDLMVLRGYSYMNLKSYYEALRIFEAAAATGNRDASRGIADIKAMLER
jgi:hypothetical protein